MRKLLGILGVFAFTSLFVISANAASAPNARGGDIYRATTIAGGSGSVNTARMPSMPGGIGGVTGSNLGGNTTANVTSCAPGAIRPCTTTGGQSGTQTCAPNGTWGACIASFTIEKCMDALLACVNGGGLENGIVDMYDENIRNSIMTGMSLCKSVVDKCIANIAVYHSAGDVWIDFNSRVVQPQYYNFVLRKTGLTPNQAENTCWLLDKNVYGKSFAAVSDGDAVTGEYNQQIGAYNSANNNSLTKPNPQGPVVNTEPYDANRGHYARWNASKAECLVRVAAYNKDDLITNRWLGIGNDKAAEVWKSAGSSFTCNKDLFEFGLMNKTKTMALLGTTIGAAVGAGTGALIGHAKDKKEALMTYCDYEDNLAKMNLELKDLTTRAVINEFLGGKPAPGAVVSVGTNDENDNPLMVKTTLKPGEQINIDQCRKVMELFNSYQQWKIMSVDGTGTVFDKMPDIVGMCSNCNLVNCKDVFQTGSDMYDKSYKVKNSESYCVLLNKANDAMISFNNAKAADAQCKEGLDAMATFIESIGCKGPDYKNKARADGKSLFKNPNRMYANFNADIFCKTEAKDCINAAEFKKQVERLGTAIESLSISNEVEEKGMSKAGKGALIGAAVGAGTGGLATAITAFVEKNNISCHVGDGLDRISMGKSGTIDTLKNYYVKWALNLPDVVGPIATATVTDCATWTAACATITNISDCVTAGLHYLPLGATVPTLVYNACAVNTTTGLCQENLPVATSQGACP